MKKLQLFFSHRTIDKPNVIALKDEISRLLPNLEFDDASMNVPDSENWKERAEALISNSDAVICIVGLTTHKSEPVDWEVNLALQEKRPVFVTCISEDCIMPASISASSLPRLVWNATELASKVGDLLIRRTLFNRELPEEFDQVLIQYNTMVSSWESLINRRQTVNSIYLSANAAIVTAIGVLVSISKDAPASKVALGTSALAALGLLLSLNWSRTISSYGILSTAKSKVILAMEEVLPVRLFDAEWKVLQSNKYKSTTQTDNFTVTIFAGLFVLVLAVSIAFLSGLWS